MVEQNGNNKNLIKEITYRILKASLKVIIIYLIYTLVTPMLASIMEMVPYLMESIESFVIFFVVLMFLSDLTQDTIYQHFFNTARHLYIIGYFLLSMGDGVMSLSYESLSLTVNLTLFYTIAVLLSLLGLARSIFKQLSLWVEKLKKKLFLRVCKKSNSFIRHFFL